MQSDFQTRMACFYLLTRKESASITKLRTLDTPTRFESKNEYCSHFYNLVNEHLQVMLSEKALRYHSISRADESAFRSNGLAVYIDCQLKRIANDNETLCVLCTSSGSISMDSNTSRFSKDDVWIVSAQPDFSNAMVCRSNYFGASSNGSFEMVPLTERDQAMSMKISPLLNQWSRGSVYAIHAFNAASEFMCLEAVDALKLGSCPISRSILNPCGQQDNLTGIIEPNQDDYLVQLISRFRTDYNLNADQVGVCRSMVNSLSLKTGPITLVHGVFGAGKSYVVSVLILLLYRLKNDGRLENGDEAFRIVVSSNTNGIPCVAENSVAVDTILKSLLKLGFTDFVRVGSMKKIAKSVLPYTASANAKNAAAEIKDLNDMLCDDSLCQEERANVGEAISRVQGTEKIDSFFVIGTTCASTKFEVFDGIGCGLLILDEASQMTEPMTLIPITRFSCKRALLVGDPLQLQPTITSNTKSKRGLDWTLFERLHLAGLPVSKLRIQYRCHPFISGLSNRLFYGGQLVDGTPQNRLSAVIEGLPPVTFVDIGDGREKYGTGGSMVNLKEAEFVVSLVQSLTHRGVNSRDIGVISLYKSQVEYIRHLLNTNNPASSMVQVNSVDAFQGGERQIIIVSTVRSKSAGFIDNTRRVNVALTRAKRHLVIAGNAALLGSNTLWRGILDLCSVRNSGRMRKAEILQVVQENDVMPVEMDEPSQDTDKEFTKEAEYNSYATKLVKELVPSENGDRSRGPYVAEPRSCAMSLDTRQPTTACPTPQDTRQPATTESDIPALSLFRINNDDDKESSSSEIEGLEELEMI